MLIYTTPWILMHSDNKRGFSFPEFPHDILEKRCPSRERRPVFIDGATSSIQRGTNFRRRRRSCSNRRRMCDACRRRCIRAAGNGVCPFVCATPGQRVVTVRRLRTGCRRDATTAPKNTRKISPVKPKMDKNLPKRKLSGFCRSKIGRATDVFYRRRAITPKVAVDRKI